jgi:hypothetical protein
MKENKKELRLPNIGLCILLDLIGMATYIFPALGEFADVVWAPISGYIFFKLFGGRLGMIGSVLNFLEEIIPFTDIIPSFTIAWFIRKKETDKLIQQNGKVLQKRQEGKPVMNV